MVMYQHGLKENMKDEITFNRQVVNILDKLIAQAININNKLFK